MVYIFCFFKTLNYVDKVEKAVYNSKFIIKIY